MPRPSLAGYPERSAEAVMSMMSDVYSQIMQANGCPDDFDIEVCENCLKSLDDPTHQAHTEKIAGADGLEYDYVCEEPTRQVCEECGEIFIESEMIRQEYWFCKKCADAEQIAEGDETGRE